MKFGWRRREELSCREVGKILQTYLDGELDELRARRVARHLEMCRRCGMAAETYAEIKQILRRSAGSPPQDAIARLRAFGQQLAEGSVPADEEESGAG
jgi:anti-sigma factor RsiW